MHRYEEISLALRRELRTRGAGARLPSFRTLMRRFGSSQATINRALRNLEDEGFVRRRPGSGLYVGQGGKKAPSSATGPIEFLVPNVSNRACALLVGGGEQAARALDLRIEVRSYGERLPRRPPDLSPDASGFVLLPRSVDVDQGLVESFLARLPPEVRCVLVDIDSPGRRGGFVGLDDFGAGASAGEVFRNRGVNKVACLGTALSHVEQARISGLAKGFGQPPETFIDFPDPEHFDRELLRRVTGSGVDGLFVARPEIALQTLCFLEALGVRVPDDLCVVTVAEEEDDKAYPYPVVTVVKPTREMGRHAVRALFDGKPTSRRLAYRIAEVS